MVSPKAATTRPAIPQKRARDERETIALFLGAGASKAFGYPLTGELLPQLIQYLDDGTLTRWDIAIEDQAVLRKGLNELMPGMATCPAGDLPLITDVLTLVDHAMYAGTTLLRGWPNREVTRFRGLLEQVIACLVGPDEGEVTQNLLNLADWIERRSATHRVGVITTNYDIELELELFGRAGLQNVASRFDFGMSWREPAEQVDRIYSRPGEQSLPYYKLHGSLNWLRCPMCEYVYVNVHDVIVGWAAVEERVDFNTCHCGHWPLHSVLVTPSYVRDTRDVNLVGIWRNSLDLLAAADRWIIVGYSLPPEDIAIRAMLLKAYRIRRDAQNRPPHRISVVQRNGAMERQRYRLMFPDAQYHDAGIETFDFDAAMS